MLVAATFAAPLLAAPAPVSAEGLFDFFFGGAQQQRPQQASSYADPFTGQQNAPVQSQYVPPTRSAAAGGSGPAFCVRSCDGKYFPLMRGIASPAQLRRPASATPTARTHSPTARRCARTAPATAASRSASPRSTSRWTLR